MARYHHIKIIIIMMDNMIILICFVLPFLLLCKRNIHYCMEIIFLTMQSQLLLNKTI